MIFFIIFLIIPLIEIGLFITIGGEIGLLPTLLLTVLTAIIGSTLIRIQGLQTLFSAKTHLQSGKLPVQALFDGFCLVVAGVCLITPGFFTDGIGFLLLLPPFRNRLWHILPRYMDVAFYESTTVSQPGRKNGEDSIIEGDYEILDDKDKS